MPSRKGPGKEKGKGKAPAPKRPQARPREPDPSSGSEDEGQLVMARILSRLEALESRKKATRGEGSKAVGKQGARKAGNQPNKQLQLLQSIEARLDALESGEGEATGAMENASRNALDADVGSFGGALSNSRPSSQGASRSFSTPPMEPWILEAEEAIRLSLAPSTRVRYASAIREFHAFRVDTGLEDLWPIPVEHIMRYSTHLHGRGLATGSIGGKLAALAFQAKMKGFADSTADFRVRRMLEGWARVNPSQPDTRVPLAPTTLQQVLPLFNDICFSNFEVRLLRASCLVAFFGALRISELVASSRSDTSARALQWGDARVERDKVELRLRRAKTDQKGKGATITLAEGTDEGLCPVRAMRDYMAVRGEGEGQLFRHADATPLTRFQFWALVKEALRRAGLDPRVYGTHSFRIGAASSAAAAGLTEKRIRALGRWRSSACRRYIRPLPK
ncbi:uncharacterized protein LOC128347973 isoform X1 [Hemicordylus capensis]|uniref:uncharacterized protein LOC128341688 n=1 Tax=Hemicordylus capensis TaxID=884348 RepID=UPI0023044355|nr:uncharacterized protein LOC128341688 [Hemicordylus capensis]XP_053159345.1 uncharacterized protein LOC128347973 isoform X1 [Hemicordylus capensis]